jgi:hypothetical protein
MVLGDKYEKGKKKEVEIKGRFKLKRQNNCKRGIKKTKAKSVSGKYLSITGRGKNQFQRGGGGFRPTYFIDLYR